MVEFNRLCNLFRGPATIEPGHSDLLQIYSYGGRVDVYNYSCIKYNKRGGTWGIQQMKYKHLHAQDQNPW